jgi:gluconolactonase
VFEQIDERFRGVAGDEYVEALYDEGRWLEGPAYSRAWQSLLFSDIPNDRVLRFDETTGAVGVWRQPAGYANGRTLDRRGRVISCEQGSRSVTRTEFDGSVTVLADRRDGRRLNSPNDVVVRADGTVWFTDPSYGIDSDYEAGPGFDTRTGPAAELGADWLCRHAYSSWRRKKLIGSSAARSSLRPRGARSSHWYMPQSPSSPRA